MSSNYSGRAADLPEGSVIAVRADDPRHPDGSVATRFRYNPTGPVEVVYQRVIDGLLDDGYPWRGINKGPTTDHDVQRAFDAGAAEVLRYGTGQEQS